MGRAVERGLLEMPSDQHQPDRLVAVPEPAGDRNRRVAADVERRGVADRLPAMLHRFEERRVAGRDLRSRHRRRRHQQEIVFGEHRVIGRLQQAALVLRLGVEMPAIGLVGIAAQQEAEAEGMREFLGAGTRPVHLVDQRGRVDAAGVLAEPVAPEHRVVHPVGADPAPDREPGHVHRDRDFGDLRAEGFEMPGGRAHRRIDIGQRVVAAEPLRDDGDPQTPDIAAERVGVAVDARHPLARIQPVLARHRFEEERVVRDGPGHRSGVVDRGFDPHDPGIGDEAEGRLDADDAGHRRRDADRARLVAAERHVDLAGGDQRRAPGGGAARGVARVARAFGDVRGGCVAAAGDAEILAHRLAEDRRPRIEQPGDHACVHIRHVAFEHRGAVHHRDAGDAGAVLDGDRPALERAVRRALDPRLDVPAAMRVLRPVGARPRAARILDRRQIVRRLLDLVEGIDERRPEGLYVLDFRVVDGEADLVGYLLDRACARRFVFHPFLPEFNLPPGSRARRSPRRRGRAERP